MLLPDSLANGTRAAHDVGLAAWLGGAMFGKFAHNPSLTRITSHTERGAVANAAWNGYNLVNAAGLGAAALGWGAARLTETRPDKLTGVERRLSSAKDALMLAAIVTGAGSGVLGARLAKQAPDGAVPVETGVVPAMETPPAAARIQRGIGMLSTANVVAGVALVAVNGVLAQIEHSHPPVRRAVRASSGTSPLWIGSAISTAVAAGDQLRRAVA